MGTFDVKQVCLNGHVTNDLVGYQPERNKTFCPTCGEKTITECPSCKKSIRGAYRSSASVGSSWEAQPFCEHCGEPFPWTEKILNAGDELVDEFEGLSPDERETLKSSIHDLVQQNPHQTVAEVRIKKLTGKIGAEGADLLRKLLQGYISGQILKSLFG